MILFEVINRFGLVCYHTTSEDNFKWYCDGLDKQKIKYSTNYKKI